MDVQILLGRWVDADDHMYTENLAAFQNWCSPFVNVWGRVPPFSPALFSVYFSSLAGFFICARSERYRILTVGNFEIQVFCTTHRVSVVTCLTANSNCPRL